MAKIEKDRPLPSHTKLDYDECYAKIVLEKFFPDQYEICRFRINRICGISLTILG